MNPRRSLQFASLLLLAAPLVAVADRSAHADVGWNLRLEGGVAGPLNDPQKRLFVVGGDTQLRLALEPTSWLDLYVNGGFLGLHPKDANPSQRIGDAWNLGGGIRLKRPYKYGIVSPWVDADLGWYRAGRDLDRDIDRIGFSVGAGINFAVGHKRNFRLGPYLRYTQIVQLDHDTVQPVPQGTRTYDSTDAKILMGGISLEFGGTPKMKPGVPKDRDGDGIPDVDDKCPDQPEDRDGFEDNDGCPDPDNDRDGVLDINDKCPNEAEDKDGFQDDDGCPDPDNDGDGILDINDKCPNQPEDKDGFQDDDGCPDPDNDGDGILDADDKCPNAAGPADTGGCPDRDHDKVDDQHDECPDVAGLPANKGCPVYSKVKVTESKIEITEKIFFAFDKATILPKSFPLLTEVTKVLKDHSGLKVRVEGHTDSKGKADHNKKLSLDRANSVRDFLVKAGISADRLEAQGFGAEQPLDTNKTETGREKNRRVEFVITNQQGAQ